MGFIDKLETHAKTAEQAIAFYRKLNPQTKLSSHPQETIKLESQPISSKSLEDLRQAFSHRQKSGVGELAKRLGLALASDMQADDYPGPGYGGVHAFSRGTSFGPDYRIITDDLPSYPLRALDLSMGINIIDRGSTVVDQVVWHKPWSDGSPVGGGRFFIGIFSLQDGCVGFMGKNYGKPEVVREANWSQNPDLLEQTLERFFNEEHGNKHDLLTYSEGREHRERDAREQYYGIGRHDRSPRYTTRRWPGM